MPNEYFPGPNNPVFYNGTPERERDRIIRTVTEEVTDRVNELRNSRYSYPQNLKEMEDVIISGTGEMQLMALALFVFEISSNEDETSFIDLEYTNTVPITIPSEFSVYSEELQMAAKKGEIQGTNDFLKILVPSDITDPTSREIYYSPWRKDLLRRKGILHDNADKSALAVLKTVLPNIGVLYHYPPFHDFPERTIRLMYGLDEN